MVQDNIPARGYQLAAFITNDNLMGVLAFLAEGFRDGYESLQSFVNPVGPALHYAATMGRTEICKALIDAGADVNFQMAFGSGEKYDLGRSPLHHASQYQMAGIVQLLLERGADPNATTLYGVRPLHEATCNKEMYTDWVKVVDLLLEYGADPNVALERVLEQKHWSNQDHFLKKHQYQKPKLFLTPLHLALESSGEIDAGRRASSIEFGYAGSKVVESLLRRGADPFVLPEGAPAFYMTPLQTAVKMGAEEDVRIMLTLDGVDLGQKTLAGRSLAQLANDRPPGIKSIIMAAKTDRLVRDSVTIEKSKEVDVQTVKKSKGMVPL